MADLEREWYDLSRRMGPVLSAAGHTRLVFRVERGNFMSDWERILEELRNRIKRVEELERVSRVCAEICDAYDDGSAGAVSELLESQIDVLNQAFDDAFGTLSNAMGL